MQTLGFELSLIISVIPYLTHSESPVFGLVYKTQIASLLLGRLEHETDNSTFEQGIDPGVPSPKAAPAISHQRSVTLAQTFVTHGIRYFIGTRAYSQLSVRHS